MVFDLKSIMAIIRYARPFAKTAVGRTGGNSSLWQSEISRDLTNNRLIFLTISSSEMTFLPAI
jgi:hypothetical protein